MKLYDLTVQIDKNTKEYPGDPQFLLKPHTILSETGCNVSELCIGSHMGTHIDFPRHFIDNGKSACDYDIIKFTGPAVVLHSCINEKNELTLSCVQKAQINTDDIVILSTDWEKKLGTDQYFKDVPVISQKLAEYFITKKIKAIGSDLPTIDKDGAIHKQLLRNDILIYESLINIDRLIETRGIFTGMPLKLQNSDGSPVRAYFCEREAFLYE